MAVGVAAGACRRIDSAVVDADVCLRDGLPLAPRDHHRVRIAAFDTKRWRERFDVDLDDRGRHNSRGAIRLPPLL